MKETRIRALGSEDPLEKEMAIHSSTVAWKIPWTEEPGRLQSMGSLRVDTTKRLHFHFSLSCVCKRGIYFRALVHKFVERKVKVKSLSRVRLFVTPWTVAYHASPSMGFSRQEYWSGLPFPSPGDLPNPGIKPGSPALQTDALPSKLPGKLAQ